MKLCIASWSLRAHVGRSFPVYDLPQVVRDRFGVAAVEVAQVHLSNPSATHLDRLVDGLGAAGSSLVSVPIDVGNIAQRDLRRRTHDLAVVRLWLDAAAYLGSPLARVNTGYHAPPFDLDLVSDAYRTLVEHTRPLGLTLLIENHGGLSADPEHVVQIIEGVGPEWLGTCPDFGNFAPEIRYAGLARLAPYARLVHAKSYAFDARGEDTRIDFGRCLAILRDAGYDGYLSIEYEGDGDQFDGVRQTIELVRRYVPDIQE
jgi:sugar phosphate isomerase/epimerase